MHVVRPSPFPEHACLGVAAAQDEAHVPGWGSEKRAEALDPAVKVPMGWPPTCGSHAQHDHVHVRLQPLGSWEAKRMAPNAYNCSPDKDPQAVTPTTGSWATIRHTWATLAKHNPGGAPRPALVWWYSMELTFMAPLRRVIPWPRARCRREKASCVGGAAFCICQCCCSKFHWSGCAYVAVARLTAVVQCASFAVVPLA